MLRIPVTFFVLVVNLVLQSTFFQHIQIRGVLPNTSIAIIVSYALLRGSLEGALTGLCAGLMQDIFFGSSIGFYGLLGMHTGYFCGKLNENFYRENILLPLFLTGLSVFFYELFVYVTHFLFKNNLDFLYYFHNLILPEIVYTVATSLIVFRILFGINRRLEQREVYKRKLF